MTNYFIFKDIDSRNINGLIVATLPPISRPSIRTETIEIDGLDGDIVIEQGYKAYDKVIKIYLKDLSVINDVMDWLTGEGNLITSSEDEYYYKVKVIEGIDFQRFVSTRTGEIVFHVQPFKYLVDESDINASASQITNQSMTVSNQGNISSKPLIRLTGSGTVTFKLNGFDVFTYTFPTDDTYVDIDSEEQDAFVGPTLKNRNMNGDFPVLASGSNTITWTGTLTALKVTPRSRWL